MREGIEWQNIDYFNNKVSLQFCFLLHNNVLLIKLFFNRLFVI